MKEEDEPEEEPIEFETASESNALRIASSSNALKRTKAAVSKTAKASERDSGREKFKATLSHDKKTGKLTLKLTTNCVLYDEDGKTSTKADQIRLKGGYEIKDLYPQVAIDWPLMDDAWGSLWKLDFLPNQLMAKVSCEDKANLGLECSDEVDFKKLVKMINDANMVHANEYDFLLFKLQGIDFSKSAVLWAGGINVGTGRVGTDMKTLQNTSLVTPLSPTIVVMLLLDIDGNITAKISANLEKESYRELGVNCQEKSYTGVGGTVEQNKGEANFDLGSYMMNIYVKEWRSKTDSRSSGYTITVKAEGVSQTKGY